MTWPCYKMLFLPLVCGLLLGLRSPVGFLLTTTSCPCSGCKHFWALTVDPAE